MPLRYGLPLPAWINPFKNLENQGKRHELQGLVLGVFVLTRTRQLYGPRLQCLSVVFRSIPDVLSHRVPPVLLHSRPIPKTERQPVAQPVNVIVRDRKHVVAIGDKGRMWVFSATNLDNLRTIDLSTGSFAPRGAAIEGDSLYVTDGRQNSATSVVFMLDAWRPGTAFAAHKPQATKAPP
jgi:hypothetical protein